MMKRQAGFSLIELMIAIAIMGVLLSLGVPAFTTYINNAKLRATAQSFLAGVQQARSEAVRRNANVDFVLTNEDFAGAAFATVAPSTSGQNWFIRTSDLATFVEGKYGVEGSGRAAGETSPVQVAGSVSSLTFTGLGSTTLMGAATFSFSNPTGGACAPTGPIRCLDVRVSAGGQARLCDPAVSAAATAAGDTRGC
jgi:type IV fimbrial biogenesis protein FimT